MDHITDSNHTHTLCVDLLPQRDWSTAPSCELYTCGFIVGDAADVLRVGFGPFNARNGGGKFGHRASDSITPVGERDVCTVASMSFAGSELSYTYLTSVCK
eukprot:195271-Amorphochlora_amoeboformis.AAC.2